MKEHDRTTTKRIQDNRLRVSLLKNTKILIPVHILSQEVFPQLLLVSRYFQHMTRFKHIKFTNNRARKTDSVIQVITTQKKRVHLHSPMGWVSYLHRAATTNYLCCGQALEDSLGAGRIGLTHTFIIYRRQR